MSNLDKQIANALDTLHRQIWGGRAVDGCRWYYSHAEDIYHCPHTAIRGKDLMQEIPEWLAFNESTPTPTKEYWDSLPESEHPL